MTIPSLFTPQPPLSVVNPYEHMKIKLNPNDRSLRRNYVVPMVPPTLNPTHDSPTLSKDIHLNVATDTSLRLFLPHPTSHHKLPITIYFHSDDFILHHPSFLIFHTSYVAFAATIHALFAFIGYTLCPKHCLLATYDDT
ncbi:hypothetical protein Fmac_011826 [Flemingia macrophylla]|uniref:Uncharacterized protein n=1 Tax=Flemingia macrophylla TaxID=520843 RepID=A0ABD1MNJ3_9FABA